MKKLLVLITSLFCILSSAAAFEWGGVVKNESQLATSDFSNLNVQQTDSLYLWLKTPMGKNWNFSAEGFYKFKYNHVNKANSIVNVLDIDLLKVSGQIKAGNGSVTINAGRFFVSDATGITFNQISDGLFVKYSLPVFQASLYAGYTGLLNTNSVYMIGSDGKTSAPEHQLYDLASGYVPLNVSFTFPVIFANQSLNIQGSAFIDATGNSYNRYYASAGFSGYISNSFYYNLLTQFGSVNFENVMNYTLLSVTYCPSKKINVEFGGNYASGKNGFLSPYVAVTSNNPYKSRVAPEYSGVIMPYAGATFVTGSVVTKLNAKTVLDCAESFEFKGFDLSAICNYRVLSDLQLGAEVHGFVDVAKKGSENYFFVNLNASVAF